jgi:hypothetical protein
VLCNCGNIIGIKVFSGLKDEVGKWRIFSDQIKQKGQYQNIVSKPFRNFIFETSLKNNITLVL